MGIFYFPTVSKYFLFPGRLWDFFAVTGVERGLLFVLRSTSNLNSVSCPDILHLLLF